MAAKWLKSVPYNSIYDQNGLKTIPFGAAHTYVVSVACMRENPPGVLWSGAAFTRTLFLYLNRIAFNTCTAAIETVIETVSL